MKRILIVIVSVLLVVAIGGGAYTVVAKDRNWWPFGNNTVLFSPSNLVTILPDLLPADTAMYAHLDLNNPVVAQQVASNQQLAASVATLKQGLEKLTNKPTDTNSSAVDGDLTPELKAFLAEALQRDIDVALIYTPTATNSTAETVINDTKVIMAMEVQDENDATQQTLALKSTLKSLAGNPDSFTSTDSMVGNQTVTTLSAVGSDSMKQNIVMTNLQNKLLVVTNDMTTLTELLQRNQDKKLPSLTNQTSYSTLMNKISGPQFMTAYINGEKQMAWQNSMTQTSDMTPAERQLQTQLAKDMSNLSKSQSVIGGSFNTKGMLFTGFTSFADNTVTAKFQNSTPKFTANAPADSLLFVENTNIAGQLELFSAVFNGLNTLMTDDDTTQPNLMQQFEQTTGLNAARDLAPLFQKQSALAVHPVDSFFVPVAASLMTEVSNMTQAETTMKKLTDFVIKSFDSSMGDPTVTTPGKAIEQTDGSNKIVSYGNLMGEEQPSGNDYLYNYTLRAADQSLFVSSSLSALKALLTATAPLQNSPSYPEFLKQAGAVNNVTFINVRGLVTLAKPFLDSMNSDETEQQAFEKDVMPFLNLVRNISSYSKADGELIRSDVQVQLVD
ncbi:hypothetical protein KA517_00940 [Candidatus Gracilibacteria bacterium]|nr:hypothetical protein [Candidatus Gracilibacteria bacterium]